MAEYYSKIIPRTAVPELLAPEEIKLCPFTIYMEGFPSSSESSYNLIYHECVREKCQFWDAGKSQCEVVNMSNKMDSSNAHLNMLNIIIDHWHRSHLHCRTHATPNLNVGNGKELTCSNSITPYSSELVLEYMCNEDMDGNGKIYGKDFGIRDDANKPPILKNMELGFEKWESPPKQISWKSLLNWRKGSGPDPLS